MRNQEGYKFLKFAKLVEAAGIDPRPLLPVVGLVSLGRCGAAPARGEDLGSTPIGY